MKIGLSPCCNLCAYQKIEEHGARVCQVHTRFVLAGNICDAFEGNSRIFQDGVLEQRSGWVTQGKQVRRGMRIVARLWKGKKRVGPDGQVITPAMSGRYPAERFTMREDGTVKREVHLCGGFYVEAEAKAGPDGGEPSGC